MKNPKTHPDDVMMVAIDMFAYENIYEANHWMVFASMMVEIGLSSPIGTKNVAELCASIQSISKDSQSEFQEFRKCLTLHVQHELMRYGIVMPIKHDAELERKAQECNFVMDDFKLVPFDVKEALKNWHQIKNCDFSVPPPPLKRFKSLIRFMACLYETANLFSVQNIQDLMEMFIESKDDDLIECLFTLLIIVGNGFILEESTARYMDWSDFFFRLKPLKHFYKRIDELSKDKSITISRDRRIMLKALLRVNKMTNDTPDTEMSSFKGKFAKVRAIENAKEQLDIVKGVVEKMDKIRLDEVNKQFNSTQVF